METEQNEEVSNFGFLSMYSFFFVEILFSNSIELFFTSEDRKVLPNLKFTLINHVCKFSLLLT